MKVTVDLFHRNGRWEETVEYMVPLEFQQEIPGKPLTYYFKSWLTKRLVEDKGNRIAVASKEANVNIQSLLDGPLMVI